MAGGLALAAVGFGVLTQFDGGSALAVLVIGSVVFSLGVTPVGTLATDIIIGSAPPERAGAASGISETGAEFGGALGIAILGTIGTAVYRGRMADGVPTGVAPDAADVARDTLGGALAVADRMPDPLGAELLGTAREAFVHGLQMAAAVSAAVAIATAIVAVVLLRGMPASAGPEDQPDADASDPSPNVAPAA